MKMRVCTTILSLLLVVFLFGSASAESFWPMFQQNPGHTGVAPVSTAPELELLWGTNGSTDSSSHLVLGSDGSLWAVGDNVDRLSPRGEVIFHITPSDVGIMGSFKGQGSPAVLADGTLIVMAGVRNEDKLFVPTLYAIEPNENVRWTLPFEEQAPANSLITLASDGQIYVGCPTCLYSVTQEGGITWSYDCDDQIETIPAVANDGSVYFGTRNSTLYCLSPDGLLDWTFRPEGTASWIQSAPTLDHNERVYFTVSSNGLYCLNSDGSVEFSYPIQKSCYTSPILMPDGSIAFYERAEAGPQITRLNADGSKRWATPLPTS
ncbi:PQQ-like beta-propeller repeat protein, partial [bacterium]|nr:PQQ-like beta-propeller repeat protein [bacterium]